MGGRLEIAPTVREDYRGDNSLMLVCVGRLEIAPTVRENYSEGKLLIFTAFSLLVGAIFNRPQYREY